MGNTTFEWGQIVLHLSLVFILVLLNGVFVAAEFSLVKVRQSRLQQLVNEGNIRAKYALSVTNHLDAYLSATQLGITLASLGLGWTGEKAIAHLIIEPLFHLLHLDIGTISTTISFIVSFALVTFLHIVLGELAPKSLAIQKPESAALWLSAPLLWFYKLFLPAIWLLNGAANLLLRLFGIQPAAEQDVHTEEEIRILMNQSARSGEIDKEEMEIFDNVFEFSGRVAREVMLPRTDMDCLFLSQSYEDNLKLVLETKHTRYPIAVEDKDQVVGFVHITDLLLPDGEERDREEKDLKRFIRPILNVPESMEISRVLRLMQKKHSQLAIVVDEYGGTAGLLTLEDIMEEIVGELHDEFDEHERPEVEYNGNVISVDGRMLIEDLDDLLGMNIEDDEVDSIGGWLFKKLEGSPVKGQQIIFGDYIFEVGEVDRLRIMRVHLKKKDESSSIKDHFSGISDG